MANPDFITNGTEQASTGAITVNMPPSWAAGQIALLFVATDGFTPSLSTPSGFVLAQDPSGNSASVTAGLGICGMFVFWKRLIGTTTATDPAPVIAAPSGGGTVQCCHMNTYSNCRASGTPFHVITTAIVSSAATAITPPTITTTLAGCTVFSLAASENNDSTFNSWGSTGSASPAGTIDSGWNSGLGNACAWAGGRGGFATAGAGRNCTSNFGTSTRQAQITFALASLAELGVSGTANVGGITSTGAAITGTLASGAANVGGITGTGSATSPGAASGTANVGGITSTGSAASPAVASGAANVGGITGTGSAGQSLFGTIGASAAAQRADQTGPATGTMTTAFVARTPSAAVAINDRLAFNSRRWHVNSAGTLSAGSGPTGGVGSGIQADGSAGLVALTSTDTTLTMTTQAANSVLLGCVMRENWNGDPSAPTSNKGGTFALQGSVHFYSAFPTAAVALYAMVNAAGGSGHACSLTWPVNNVTGAEATLLVVEVPTGRSTSFVQASSFVEVASSSTETTASVTTTGPAMLVAFWLGAGGVITIGSAHVANAVAPFTALPNADTMVAIHANGYIQGRAAWTFASAPGTYTAQFSSVAEPALLFLIAIQEVAGSAASGTANVGGITSAGAAVSNTTTAASGAANVGGITGAGAARPGTFASGTANVGGITGTGAATSTPAVSGSASGSSSVGGITSAGATTTGTFAAGAAAVGGITSAGAASTPGTASGSATVGGIASSGVATSSHPVASGSSSVGGITSTGIAGTPQAGSLRPIVTARAPRLLTVRAR